MRDKLFSCILLNFKLMRDLPLLHRGGKMSYRKTYANLTNAEKQEMMEYFTNMYPSDTKGFVKVWNMKSKRYYFYESSQLGEANYWEDVICNNKYKLYSENNLVISMNGFISPNRASEKNLLYVNAWAIDVDYKKHGTGTYKDLTPLKMFEKHIKPFCGTDYLPMPTYIETGNQLRLIYILDRFMGLSSKSREKQINLVKAIKAHIERELNRHPCSAKWGIDVGHNGLASFVRVPYSLKNGYTVRIKKVGSKVNLEQLASYYLPVRSPKTEHSPTNNSKKNFNRKFRTRDIKELNEQRLLDFTKIQDYMNSHEPTGHREILLHLYRIHAFLLTENVIESLHMTLEFNQGFKYPLNPKEVMNDTKYSWKSNPYKNKTILEILDISSELANRLGLTIRFEKNYYGRQKRYYERKRKEAEKSGKTKKQKIEERQKNVLKYLSEGKSTSEIANCLEVSISTVKRDIKELKENSYLT